MKRTFFSIALVVSILALSLPLLAGEIHDAVRAGDVARVRAILQADPGAVNERDSESQFAELPIHYAATVGNVEIARLLIEAGAQVDAGDSDNSTALGVAGMRRHVDMVNFLLEQGANVNHRDRKADTPMSFACYRGNEAVIDILLEAGADLYFRSPNGETLLHRACQRGLPTLARRIIENGVDIDTQADHGATPLGYAAISGDVDIARMLIEAGARVNPPIKEGQMSPLAYNTWSGNLDCARLLIANGADVNDRMFGRRTILTAAVQNTPVEFVQLLLDSGAEVDLVDDQGKTALVQAAEAGNPEMVRALLAAGAKPDLGTDNSGRTALQLAAIRGYGDITRQLLAAGAGADCTGECGVSPAQLARYYGNDEVAGILAGGGARTKAGKTDRSLSKIGKVGNKEAAIYFLGHSAWAVKTRNNLMIFDFFRDGVAADSPSLCNGTIDPAELAGCKVTVFASHQHGDHYWPGIFEWGEQVEDITYFLGHQPRDTVPEFTFMPPRMVEQFGDIKLTTISSTDSGVGMLIEVDGVTIFHGGDHANGRLGLMDEFTDEIDFLAENCPRPDICIMGIRGCSLGTPPQVKEGVVYALGKLKPKTFLPMHAGADGAAYREFIEEMRGQFGRIDMAAPDNRGDHFIYKNGKLKDPKPFAQALVAARAKACEGSAAEGCSND
ncbi:MAG TPA: ankyrin repeat domain-containing protein [Candidatus Krumholzibacterium sp.]|nr:ankyrin repeat domain-containing protein [Candidatus Krumholzibacterium sp.]